MADEHDTPAARTPTRTQRAWRMAVAVTISRRSLTRPRHRQRSRVRHERRPAHAPSIAPSMPGAPTISARAGCRTKFVADPAALSDADERERRAGRARARSTPARCIRRSARSARAHARSAAWRWSRVDVSADSGPNPELVDMTRRFWIALALTLPVVRARDGQPSARLGPRDRAGASRTGCSSLLATPVVLWAGWPFFERGWRSLLTRNLNMFTLIAHRHRRRPGSTASSRRCCPGIFPPALQGHDGIGRRSTSRPPPSSPCWCCLGQVLELRAREQHRRRHPRAARPRAEDGAAHRGRRIGATRMSASTQVAIGDRLRVRPGEKRARRRRGRRGPQRRRRIDGHRRVDAGRQGSRATTSSAARINQSGALRHARPRRSAATPCSRASCRWSPRRSAAARPSSASPTGGGLVRAGGHR